MFTFLGDAATVIEACDGSFDDPTLGLLHEPFGVSGSFDDFGFETRQDSGEPVRKNRPLIGAIGKQFLEEWKQAFHRRQRSEEHTSELQSHLNLVCRLLLEKKKKNIREMLYTT